MFREVFEFCFLKWGLRVSSIRVFWGFVGKVDLWFYLDGRYEDLYFSEFRGEGVFTLEKRYCGCCRIRGVGRGANRSSVFLKD